MDTTWALWFAFIVTVQSSFLTVRIHWQRLKETGTFLLNNVAQY